MATDLTASNPSVLLLGATLTLPTATNSQDAPLPDSLPPGVTPEMVVRGQAVFDGVGGCANCHGPQAGGLIGPSLTDAEWWHAAGSYLTILQQILVGVSADRSRSGYEMAPRGEGNLSDADVQAVAAYVWALSRR